MPRRNQHLPGRGVKSGHTDLCERRNFRRGRRPLCAGDAKRARLPARINGSRTDIHEQNLDITCDQIGLAGTLPLYGTCVILMPSAAQSSALR